MMWGCMVGRNMPFSSHAPSNSALKLLHLNPLGGPHLRSNGGRIAINEASGGGVVLSTLQSALTCGYRPPKMPAWAGHRGNVGQQGYCNHVHHSP